MASLTERSDQDGTMIPFGQLLARSVRFKELFAEGMQLVEEAADYLDGKGRADSKLLGLRVNTAYSAESMRLTTRLMQIASWLLIRRAVLDGEMTLAEGDKERGKVRIAAQNAVSSPAVFSQLPEDLQSLTTRSLRLQSRILHLDSMVSVSEAEDRPTRASAGLDEQLALLHSAYQQQG